MSKLPLSRQRRIGLALSSAVVIAGGVVFAPHAAADWEDDAVNVGCDVATTALTTWVKKASTVRLVGLFADAVAPTVSKGCKWAIKTWVLGEPATLSVNAHSQTIYFDDLVTDLPDSSATPPSTVTGQAVFEELMREIHCGGYKYRVFFQMCLDGELEPVYR
jgi:hypothetical protein